MDDAFLTEPPKDTAVHVRLAEMENIVKVSTVH